MLKSIKFILASTVLLTSLIHDANAGEILNSQDKLSKNTTQKQYNFKPFFAENDKTLPAPPSLNEFDKQVLKICGTWGHRVTRQEFLAGITDENMQKLYNKLDHTIITPHASIEVFKKELADIWFKRRGFEHVFCGKSEQNKLRGFHYIGRYLYMQQKHLAGLSTKKCSRTGTKYPVYTIAIDFTDTDGEVKTRCNVSYAYDLNAFDLITEVTNAYKQAKQHGKNHLCIYHVKHGGNSYAATFVRRNDAIVTFFPNLKPNCSNRKAKISSCNCNGK